MTKDEMKNKCTERAKIFQQAMESCHSSSPIDCIEWFADRIVELEAQIERMKCCEICSHNRGGCSYHHNWTKDCLENNHKYFELRR